ncbi:Uncharacterised protein [uncultured Eubacterium sp.]|jgi:hypothetical protein|nr:Uncharacterised protein [uncultured Eubacterium sp.]
MSYWTYITGTITVSPIGRTQAQKRYILDTVLAHLPIVSGSERDMNVYVIQKNGHNSSSSCDEFGERTNNLTDWHGNKTRSRGWLYTQDEYILVVDAALRDREFNQTYREFIKWLVRLGKRVMIENILVKIRGYDKSTIIKDYCVQNEKYSYQNVFFNLFEDISRTKDNGEPNWCEYMLYSRAKDSDYPMMLAYKYFNDKENDEEVERRIEYERGISNE